MVSSSAHHLASCDMVQYLSDGLVLFLTAVLLLLQSISISFLLLSVKINNQIHGKYPASNQLGFPSILIVP